MAVEPRLYRSISDFGEDIFHLLFGDNGPGYSYDASGEILDFAFSTPGLWCAGIWPGFLVTGIGICVGIVEFGVQFVWDLLKFVGNILVGMVVNGVIGVCVGFEIMSDLAQKAIELISSVKNQEDNLLGSQTTSQDNMKQALQVLKEGEITDQEVDLEEGSSLVSDDSSINSHI